MSVDVTTLKINITAGAYYTLQVIDKYAIITDIKTKSTFMNNRPSAYYYSWYYISGYYNYAVIPVIWTKYGLGLYKRISNNEVEESINGLFPLHSNRYTYILFGSDWIAGGLHQANKFELRLYNRLSNDIVVYLNYYSINVDEVFYNYGKIVTYISGFYVPFGYNTWRYYTLNSSKKFKCTWAYTFDKINSYTNYLPKINDYIVSSNKYGLGVGLAGNAVLFPGLIGNKLYLAAYSIHRVPNDNVWDNLNNLPPVMFGISLLYMED